MPTFVHGKASRFYLAADGAQSVIYEISDSLKDLSFPRQIDLAETSVFGNTNKTYTQGLADASISGSGQFSGGANEIDDILSGLANAATATNFAYSPAGLPSGQTFTSPVVQASASNPVFYGTAFLSSYEITGSIGDVVAISFEFQPASDITRATADITATSGSWAAV